MSLLAMALLMQAAVPARLALPVLAFPDTALDDSVAYQGYQTRLFRDVAGNTAQIYIDQRDGRVVHILADAENESIGFTARVSGAGPVSLRWDGDRAEVSRVARTRTLEYRLVAGASQIDLGLFLLGSMRVERDFQAEGRHRAPFTAAPFSLREVDRLLSALEGLPPMERRRQLALVAAPDVSTLRKRLKLSITARRCTSSCLTSVQQLSFDGRDTLTLEIRTDPRKVMAERVGNSISLRSRSGRVVPFTVRIGTQAAPLTPLTRDEIFTPQFLEFLTRARAADSVAGGGKGSPALRARWLERQVRGVELLASREKLMAGLPTYATYFGRDMLMTALMMRPIWRDVMSEFVIASVLRKLSPSGEVSHEEALGGQAVREGASEYVGLVDQYRRAIRSGNPGAADSLLARARDVLGDLRRVRENYHMIDDEYQLPILAGRWLGDNGVPAERKRAFLLDSASGGGPRVARLMRELALVARTTAAYARQPIVTNLVSFPPRDSARWASASWRDSNAGYAGGRYAMDINAIWVPHALESIGRIFETLHALGFSADSLAGTVPELMAGTPLGRYARDSLALRAAIDAWRGASKHFRVALAPSEVRSGIASRLAVMPDDERSYWRSILDATKADQDSLPFLALSLDAEGRPIGVANTDAATRLFLGEDEGEATVPDSSVAAGVLRDVRVFTRAYPAGLLVERVGPVAANDAYAPPAVWRAFDRDPYHGPRVVWGREVNLFLLGVAGRIAAAGDSLGNARPRGPDLTAYVRELRAAMGQVQSAVVASGFRSELWSYQLSNGRMIPIRYGTGGDVQLWSTTDLVVQFAMSRMAR